MESTAVSPTQEASAQVEDLRLFTPLDEDVVLQVADRVRDMYIFWDDRVRADRAAAVGLFAHLFANVNNVMFIVRGGGVLTVTNVEPNWRARVHVLAWDRAAMRRPDLLRTAALAAMRAKGLLVLDGVMPAVTPERPLLAQLAQSNARRCGMTEIGRIKGNFVYNGESVDGVWFQITREELEHG